VLNFGYTNGLILWFKETNGHRNVFVSFEMGNFKRFCFFSNVVAVISVGIVENKVCFDKLIDFDSTIYCDNFQTEY